MTKLHHIHAGAESTRLQFDALGKMSWRADGRAPMELKREVALRAATCWNLLEGIPTEALLKGALREIFDALLDRDFERARAALDKYRASLDLTEDGRLHACEACREAENEASKTPTEAA